MQNNQNDFDNRTKLQIKVENFFDAVEKRPILVAFCLFIEFIGSTISYHSDGILLKEYDKKVRIWFWIFLITFLLVSILIIILSIIYIIFNGSIN